MGGSGAGRSRAILMKIATATCRQWLVNDTRSDNDDMTSSRLFITRLYNNGRPSHHADLYYSPHSFSFCKLAPALSHRPLQLDAGRNVLPDDVDKQTPKDAAANAGTALFNVAT